MATDHIDLLHGIMTRRTSVSWPKHFTGYLANLSGISTDALYYEASPLSWYNTMMKNPRLARELLTRTETRLHYAAERPRLHIVAHSNGADIAIRTMQRRAKAGIRTETAILTGAAIHSDVSRNGLVDLIENGWLGRAIAYSSPNDIVVRRLELIPGGYGSLGARGFRRGGAETGLRVEAYQPIEEGGWGASKHRFITRVFPGFGHGKYFDADQRLKCFECILADCGV
jgi:pimeloyl-ACP methyl ester carboxylesterase